MEHENYDESRTNFNVCIRHFEASDLFIRGTETVLKLNAIPKIFNATKNISLPHVNSNGNSINDSQHECDKLKARIAKLEKEIFDTKIQHDIEIQKIKVKSEESAKKKTDKLKNTMKELSKQKSKVFRLEDVVKDLREQRYISPDDAKFLDVNDVW